MLSIRKIWFASSGTAPIGTRHAISSETGNANATNSAGSSQRRGDGTGTVVAGCFGCGVTAGCSTTRAARTVEAGGP